MKIIYFDIVTANRVFPVLFYLIVVVAFLQQCDTEQDALVENLLAVVPDDQVDHEVGSALLLQVALHLLQRQLRSS